MNIGSGSEISIRELVAVIARTTGFSGRVVWDVTKPNGQPRRRLDTTRAKSAFGFEAQISFEIGLQRTVDWYVTQQVSGRVGSPALRRRNWL